MTFVLAAIWFLLPAAAGNTAPVLVRRVPWLAAPVDGGAVWRGERVFGANKTWRGVVAAPLAGWLVGWGEHALAASSAAVRELALVSPVPPPAWWGAVLGGGAIGGDLLKSFAKRRRRVAPGHTWFPFDQLDYAIGALAALSPWAFPGWRAAAGILGVGLAIHVVAVALGRALGLRERWI